MPTYLQTASFFVHGETFNQTESIISWQFETVRLSVNFYVATFRGHIRLLAKFKFPTRKINKSCLNPRKHCILGILRLHLLSMPHVDAGVP